MEGEEIPQSGALRLTAPFSKGAKKGLAFYKKILLEPYSSIGSLKLYTPCYSCPPRMRGLTMSEGLLEEQRGSERWVPYKK